MELAARNFINTNVKIYPAQQVLLVSGIFRWFNEDFGGQAGVISFLIDHLPEDGRRAWLLKNQGAIQLRYEPYDWSLNTAE